MHLPTPLPTDKLHVHFGAGRLGFGLVLPALESSGSPYVIMNRPSKVWHPIIAGEEETQQHVAVKVRFSHDPIDKWPVFEMRRAASHAPCAKRTRARSTQVAPDLAGFVPNTHFVQTRKRGCQRNESAPSRPRRGRIPAVWGTTAHSQTDWDILVFF